MNNKKIYLDYDPQYQGIVKTAAYLWFVCFAIFMVQTVLLISNLKLFGYASAGDWDGFLRMLASNATPFILIKVNFIALRVVYIDRQCHISGPPEERLCRRNRERRERVRLTKCSTTRTAAC